MDARFGGFTVRVDCPSCGLPVPLNAPLERAHCRACTGDFAVPPRVFGDLLLHFDDRYPSIGQPYPEGPQPIIDGMQVHATCVGSAPGCEKCGHTLELGSLPSDATTTFRCAACGDAAVAFPAPAWLRALVPTARLIAATDASAAPGQGSTGTAEDASHAIALPCTQCGAPLHPTSDSERSVVCEYCKTDVYLPDDLWRRLHPVKTMSPWFVRFEGPSRGALMAARAQRVADVGRREVAVDGGEGKPARTGGGGGRTVFIGVALAACAVGAWQWRSAATKQAPAKTVYPGVDPEAVARTSLAVTPQALASRFSGRVTEIYHSGGGSLSYSGWNTDNHPCTATVCIDIRSPVYGRIDVYWDEKYKDHPNAFYIPLRHAGAMDLDDAARSKLAAQLPNGFDAWGRWFRYEDRDIHLDKNIGAKVRVTADDVKNPEWREQLDAEWKLVMGAVFKIPLAPSAGEMRVLTSPTPPPSPRASADGNEAELRALKDDLSAAELQALKAQMDAEQQQKSGAPTSRPPPATHPSSASGKTR